MVCMSEAQRNRRFIGGGMSKGRAFCFDDLDELQDAYMELEGEIRLLKERNEFVGPWLSAALEDSNVCEEMKRDIRLWFGD